jgi:phosphoglycerol transferase MdoB-like AlkP superfamily enzyme
MKNILYCIGLFFVILFLLYLNFLANLYGFNDFSLTLNYFTVFSCLLLAIIISNMNKNDFKKVSSLIIKFFFQDKTIISNDMEEFKACRVEKIDEEKGMVELLYYEKKTVMVSDLLTFHPQIEIGNYVKRESSFVYLVDNRGYKYISCIA